MHTDDRHQNPGHQDSARVRQQVNEQINETPPHAPSGLPETAFSSSVDAMLMRLGALSAWLWLALLLVIVLSVVLRYVFGEGRIELEELQWHLYAVGFLIALSLGVATDDHVRVDVVHERLPLHWRAWVEVYGTLLLMLPFVTLVLIYSLPFVHASWQVGEVSQSPGGLPMRWLIKAMLPLAFILLALAALARMSRATALLFGVPQPLPEAESINTASALDPSPRPPADNGAA